MPASISDALGVSYVSYPGCDRKFFRCDKYAATLSREGCAERFRQAQKAVGADIDPVAHCQACPIGAAHAGTGITFFSKFYLAAICPRCGKGTTRMIGNRRCVSCYNRERELRTGRNAKGHAPIKLRHLFRIELRYLVDGELRRFTDDVADTTEAIVQILRSTPGRVHFLSRVSASHPRPQ